MSNSSVRRQGLRRAAHELFLDPRVDAEKLRTTALIKTLQSVARSALPLVLNLDPRTLDAPPLSSSGNRLVSFHAYSFGVFQMDACPAWCAC